MSETNGVNGNGNGNGGGNALKLVGGLSAALLLGGGVGAVVPRGDEARIAVLETKVDDLRQEVKDLKTVVLGAFPNTKEKSR